MIKLITGAVRCGNEIKRPSDEAFSLSAEEEQFLVERKVAVYVSEELSFEGVATPEEPPVDDGAGVNSPDEGKAEEGEKTPDDTENEIPEDLDAMRFDALKALAVKVGADIKGMRSKSEIIAAIELANTIVTEGDPMPELDVEDPVE